MNKYAEEIIHALDKLNIEITIKEHDEVVSMNEYIAIEQELSSKVPKNLFLCNQQHTKFYLLIMPGIRNSERKNYQNK